MQQLKTVIHAYIHYQTSVATEAIANYIIDFFFGRIHLRKCRSNPAILTNIGNHTIETVSFTDIA